ncbi:GDP-mannose 4,6-dehydratase [Aliarcobacter cryaerophilus]|uniref:GDP-mannose 4,6-dehydratase n=1 Tax=Aliarcobacter cryaerophilus TaxID=28198 RepID=UPI00082C8C32|nr:GDP-mannose 4,6-dehydratase [Aliarcobacter cryaerophilus]
MLKKALIIGASGQDGQLLKNLLEKKKYKIIGLDSKSKIQITSFEDIANLIKENIFDEIYYLAAFHHSSEDEKPDDLFLFKKSYEVNFFGLINVLEAIKIYSKTTKLFYAASSHIFGNPNEKIQTEETPINPTNIYGISKASAIFACRYYRENYNMFISVGILYNHESVFRKESFLSKKVSKAVVEIANNQREKLEVFSLNNIVDIGSAEDFVRAMWMILNMDRVGDFIISTGKSTSIKKFIKLAFKELGLDYKKYVQAVSKEKNINKSALIGSHKKLQELTNWKPKINLKKMIKTLIYHEQNNTKGI